MCTKERATQEELPTAEHVFHETNWRLQDAIKSKGMGEMSVVQRMLHSQIWRHLKRKEVVDTQSRKVTDKIVPSVFTKNK